MKNYEEFREAILASKSPQDWVNLITEIADNFNPYTGIVNISTGSVTMLLELIFNKVKVNNYKFEPQTVVFILEKFVYPLRLEYVEDFCKQLLNRYPKGGRPVYDLIVVLKSLQLHPETKNCTDNELFIEVTDLIQNIPTEEKIQFMQDSTDLELQLELWQLINKSQLSDHDWDIILESNWLTINPEIALDIIKAKRHEKGIDIWVLILTNITSVCVVESDSDYHTKLNQEIIRIVKMINEDSEDTEILFDSYLALSDATEDYNKLKNSILEKILYLEPEIEVLEKMKEEGFFTRYENFNKSLQDEYGLNIEEAFRNLSSNFDKDTEEDIDDYKEEIFCKLFLLYRQKLEESPSRKGLDGLLGELGISLSD